jgi:hypothetical protein
MRQELPEPADQARKRLRQIVEQYGLKIRNVDGLRIAAVWEALRQFNAGLLPTVDVASMKTPKRPRDPNQLAKSIIDIATGEKPDRAVRAAKQTKRQAAEAKSSTARKKLK